MQPGTRAPAPSFEAHAHALQADKQQQEADQANLLELVEQTRAVVDKAQVGQLECMRSS